MRPLSQIIDELERAHQDANPGPIQPNNWRCVECEKILELREWLRQEQELSASMARLYEARHRNPYHSKSYKLGPCQISPGDLCYWCSEDTDPIFDTTHKDFWTDENQSKLRKWRKQQ